MQITRIHGLLPPHRTAPHRSPVPEAVHGVALPGDALPPEVDIPLHLQQSGAGIWCEARQARQVTPGLRQRQNLLQTCTGVGR
jgi:hypothetical protein